MKTISHNKPVGGVESCTLYPIDAVKTALFSKDGCEVEFRGTPIEVLLIDDASQYEEYTEQENGVIKVFHKLHLVAERNNATEWLSTDFLERISLEGTIAVVMLCDGRKLLIGYSAHFYNEQPLRLECLISSSGNNLNETPTATLRLCSCDTAFSQIIL